MSDLTLLLRSILARRSTPGYLIPAAYPITAGFFRSCRGVGKLTSGRCESRQADQYHTDSSNGRTCGNMTQFAGPPVDARATLKLSNERPVARLSRLIKTERARGGPSPRRRPAFHMPTISANREVRAAGREDACGLPPALGARSRAPRTGGPRVAPRRDQTRSALGRRIEEAVPIDTVVQPIE